MALKLALGLKPMLRAGPGPQLPPHPSCSPHPAGPWKPRAGMLLYLQVIRQSRKSLVIVSPSPGDRSAVRTREKKEFLPPPSKV